MLRIPFCLGSWDTDGKILNPTHWPHSTSQKKCYVSGSHLYYRLSKTHGLVRREGLGTLKKFIHLIRSRTRNFPTWGLVPQPLRYRVPPSQGNGFV
jgi:hypothetical protein